jgi:hypothetical protein
LVLSSIFDWYKEDFRPTQVEWIRQKAPDLKISIAFATFQQRAYDWTLNDQSAQKPVDHPAANETKPPR